MINENGQTGDGNDEELRSEGVMIGVIGGLELEVDQIHRSRTGEYVEHLHARIVGRDEGCEQIQVPGDEHQ